METINPTGPAVSVNNNSQSSFGNIAGHDINITEIYMADSDEGFSKINPAVYNDTFYAAPIFTQLVFDKLKDKRLQVLGGGSGFDKNAFARHLSSNFKNEFPTLQLKEWRDSEDFSSLFKEICEEQKETLFILPDLNPQQIGYNLAQFASIAHEYKHYIIITSEITAQSWQQAEAVLDLYWFEIPNSGIYSSETLLQYAIKKANFHRTIFKLDAELALSSETKLSPQQSMAQIAERFETPSQIDFFFMLLEANQSDDHFDKKINDAIFIIKDKRETLVTKWYQSLKASERLIALGAALLDGLFDDQFFAVMQRIAQDFWHYRDARLQSLDYCDLDFLLNFFNLERFDDGRQLITCKFPNQRAEIIRAAWPNYRRHILSAFTVLTDLAGASSAQAANRIVDTEINGNTERGKRLRVVAAETISDIGLVSLQHAEPKLLSLAASGDITTRRITAKAISRWRAFEQEEQMFSTLMRWSEKNSKNLKASIILTLKYAAEYDRPGNLDQRIMMLLIGFSNRQDLEAPLKEILEELLENHFSLIQQDVFDFFAIQSNYTELLTRFITKKYETEPLLVKSILDKWLQSCLNEASEFNRRQKPTLRDTCLILILNIYSSIPYTGDRDVISLRDVWNLLEHLQNKEQRQSIRSFILHTAASLIAVQPDYIIQYIEPIYKKFGTLDRLALIQAIGIVYLRQRSLISNGYYTIVIQNYIIPVFPNQSRESTAIEKVIMQWLTGKHAFARELATLSLIEFAVILDRDEPKLTAAAVYAADAQERERIQRTQQQTQQAQQQQVQAYIHYPQMPTLSLWSRIRIFFWLWYKTAEEKIILIELMRTLLMYQKTSASYLYVVSQRMRAQRGTIGESMAWWIDKLMRF